MIKRKQFISSRTKLSAGILVTVGLVTSCASPTETPSSTGSKSGAVAAKANAPVGSVAMKLVSGPSDFEAGKESALKFQLTDPATNVPLTKFETTHEKPLHLVVVDEGLTDFQHVHPNMASDGTWSLPTSMAGSGHYFVFADGKVEGGPSFVAKQDLTVTGAPKITAGGFDLSSKTKVGDMVATILNPDALGGDSKTGVRVQVTPPDGWQPYLGAPGHLILIKRDGSEFIHAHPSGMKDGVAEFMADFKSGGVYRAWAQFQRDGKVVTFPFTVEAKQSTASSMQGMPGM